ncbi:MAG: hypothetical protein WCO09_00670 [bacterium]
MKNIPSGTIFITQAFQLDRQQNVLADIYEQVKTKDNTYATIIDGQYIRVTFEKKLSNKNDNTIYAKSADINNPASVEVFPVYTDEK